MVMLERLVGVIVSNIQPRSPLWFHDELEKAAKQGWILSSSDVEALIGVKPKGEMFHRGGNILFNIKLMIFILIFTYEYTKPGF